eukprot:CAMPEP_0194735810 /NCGR_PEP_ID=MMETSP0296-20130528/75068_1 /TAXON_ID=39354 /ORGANISM="Heterosigma akashiwo, Strain CCMP2393" /LENGTH=104 /DNA_ID=CAMNT_0039645153 /DNA_START=424 /DNA_END=736 /DNA_ORIENTATION=+
MRVALSPAALDQCLATAATAALRRRHLGQWVRRERLHHALHVVDLGEQQAEHPFAVLPGQVPQRHLAGGLRGQCARQVLLPQQPRQPGVPAAAAALFGQAPCER